MKKWLSFASVLALAFMLAACGSNNGGDKGKEEVVDLGPATSEVVITASNWQFDQEEYKIKAGEVVDLTLKSVEGVHGVNIVKSKFPEIKNNKSVTVKFDEPGTYDIICSVPCGTGHATMKSKLIVEA